MASFQILKSSLSPSSFSKSDSRKYSSWVRTQSNLNLRRKQFLGCQASKSRLGHHLVTNGGLRVFCTLEESDQQNNGEEPPESLFMKELRKRGMSPASSLLEEKLRNISYPHDDAKTFTGGEEGYYKQNVFFPYHGTNLSSQRQQSMALNSEGLEGLIPRAKVLLSIGGTFFLAFGPLILLTVAVFFGLYFYFGTAFIHDASSATITTPQYIDPYALLEDQRISEMARRLN